MKNLYPLIIIAMLMASGCTSQKKLAYLGKLPETGGQATFPMDVPYYRLKPNDVLYITVKAMSPEGTIKDFLSSGIGANMGSSQGEGLGLYGSNVNSEGNVILPAIGTVKVSGLTLEEATKALQEIVDKVFNNATVECKLLSFKYTVIGEVKAPGTFINYNNYLTILEAVGRAGGLTDQGNRDRVLVVRPFDKGTKTFRVSLQDNNLFSSEAYTLLPNDVIIVEPLKQKILTLNIPTVSSVIGIITTTLLLIFYFKK
jgi:polysaccharide export outer membrane protein